MAPLGPSDGLSATFGIVFWARTSTGSCPDTFFALFFFQSAHRGGVLCFFLPPFFSSHAVPVKAAPGSAGGVAWIDFLESNVQSNAATHTQMRTVHSFPLFHSQGIPHRPHALLKTIFVRRHLLQGSFFLDLADPQAPESCRSQACLHLASSRRKKRESSGVAHPQLGRQRPKGPARHLHLSPHMTPPAFGLQLHVVWWRPQASMSSSLPLMGTPFA